MRVNNCQTLIRELSHKVRDLDQLTIIEWQNCERRETLNEIQEFKRPGCVVPSEKPTVPFRDDQ